MHRLLQIMLCAVAWCALPYGSASADTYPSRTVTIVVPYPAGGTTDVLARAVGNELSKLWKQPVVVENQGGASSIIGTSRVVKSDPDGYTLLLTIDSTIVHNRFLFKRLPYDPDTSLLPISMLARSGQLVIAHPSFPAKNLHELVEVARKSPAGITYGSWGNGTQPNLLYETLGKREHLKFIHVPYKGIAPVVTAVTAGEVQVSVASPGAAAAMVNASKIRALAIGGTKRSNILPNVPTMAESGYPYIDSAIWWGMFAPKGTDPKLIAKINRDVINVAKQPGFIQRHMTTLGMDPVLSSPAEFTALIKNDVKTIGEMARAAGVKPIE